MRFFNLSLRRGKIASTLVLTVVLLLAGGRFAAKAGAQDAVGAPAPETPPPPALFENRIPPDQLVFLHGYAGRTAKEIRKDKQFKALMKLAIPRTEFHYGSDMPLSNAVETLLDGAPMPIDLRDGRYAMVASHGGPYLEGRGFLWFDLQEGIALGGVYFHPVNGEPTPTLAIFSRQLKDTELSMGQLPAAFQQDLAQWMLVAGPRVVSPRYFIPENGKKYVLLHDEDYCAHREGTAAPPQDRCEVLNAEAADADMKAAYFMQQTHNAANATAWMPGANLLGAGQVAWIGARESTCGPAGFVCWIRITRQRTRVLLGPQPN